MVACCDVTYRHLSRWTVQHNQLRCPIFCQRFKPEDLQSGSAGHLTVWFRFFFFLLIFMNVGNNEVKGCKMLPANLSLSKETIKSNGC